MAKDPRIRTPKPINPVQELDRTIRTARMMYGLPILLKTDDLPFGYDTVKTDADGTWAMPNDDAFKLLVKAKHFKQYSAARKVTSWLNVELQKITYDTSTIRNYNPKTGLHHSGIAVLLKTRPPVDECLLPLYERERIFRIEIQSILAGLGITRSSELGQAE